MKTATILLSLHLLSPVSQAAPVKDNAQLLPQPSSMEVLSGSFTLNSETSISMSDPKLLPYVSPFAQQLRKATGWEIPFVDKGSIVFSISPKKADGYQLNISSTQVQISASKPEGHAQAAQSVLQLCPPLVYSKSLQPSLKKGWQVPALQISDSPRFQWRGIHVDVSRTFQSKETILKLLDSMAMVKLNTLHFHLTDDQGWRAEIAGYPKLTSNPKARYTKQDMKEMVKYAKSRGITIVPEIDVPGHSAAVARAYPELCVANPQKKNKRHNVYDVSNPDVYIFLDAVMREMSDIFGNGYIHLGADEVGKGAWKNDKGCQEYMKKHGIKSLHDLEANFVARVAKLITKYNCTPIAWDEAYNAHADKNMLIMSWRGVEPGLEAAENGHKVVLTPVSALYYDRTQSRSSAHPRGYSSNTVSMSQSYFFEPQSPTISAEAKLNILGAQGCVWGEKIKSDKHMHKQVMLRGAALSEALWSKRENLDWNDYLKRLEIHRSRLDAAGIPYWWEHSTTARKVGELTVSDSPKEINMDVTKTVTEKGLYEWMFHYKNGAGTFTITKAELLEDGKVVASDLHDYTATIEPRRPNQYYLLNLEKRNPNAVYTLRFTATPVKGGSTGTIVVLPPLKADQYAEDRDPSTKANRSGQKQPDEL